jgi:hypothetical protein
MAFDEPCLLREHLPEKIGKHGAELAGRIAA